MISVPDISNNPELMKRHFEQHPELVGQEKKKEYELPVISASELIKRKPDKRFIVEKFLLPKTINMLYSPPGQFKSLISLDMALSICGGDVWMGMRTHKGKVLMLDKENSDSSLRDRLVGLLNGHDWRKKGNARMLNLIVRHGMLEDDAFLKELSEFVQENSIQLIVFDTIRRFGNYEENSSDHINRLYTSFQKIINGSNASILFLHHANKEGATYRGSVDLLGQVDSCYRVQRKGKTGDFKLICEKSRSGEIEEIDGSIDFQEENIVIKRKDVEEIEERDQYAKFNAARIWALNAIEGICPVAGGTFMRTKLVQCLEVDNADLETEKRMSPRTIDRVLFYLVKRLFLVKTGKKGEYRRLFSKENGVFTPQGEKN